ncbi:MAG TPA: helix-turn-helix domain-containing protein, partial [Bacillota bacterium]|nr:helix-turn-helix domain-containing protein [Bacillota bacterium]
MNEIGVLLREAREASGMSLEEVSEATKIRSKYLEAIEQGDFAVIPGEVYLKGFMRNYADCVGLDGGQ